MPPTRTDDARSQNAVRLLKAAAIVIGLPGTLLTFMAVVGGVVENGWVRVGGALVLAFVVPLFIADRLLDKNAAKQKAGVVTDVVALFWLGVVAIASGALGEATRGLYAAEGDRLIVAGFPGLASVAYFLGGVAATPAPTPSAATSSSAHPTTSANASATAATTASAGPASSATAAPSASASAAPSAGAH